jgi:hypothetical protein
MLGCAELVVLLSTEWLPTRNLREDDMSISSSVLCTLFETDSQFCHAQNVVDHGGRILQCLA